MKCGEALLYLMVFVLGVASGATVLEVRARQIPPFPRPTRVGSDSKILCSFLIAPSQS
jgi:hypothetical protein